MTWARANLDRRPYFFFEAGLISRTDVGAARLGFVATTLDRRTIPTRAVSGIFDFDLWATIVFMTASERTTCCCGARPCACADDAERTSVAAPMKTIRLVMALSIESSVCMLPPPSS